jgi:hypothetical protein
MDFSGTLVCDDGRLSVSGTVTQYGGGSWRGQLVFSTADAPTITPGRAELQTDGGQTWDILVSNTHLKRSGLQGVAQFGVVKGIP